MPNPISANLVALYYDTSTTPVPAWKMVACITTTTFNLGGDVIDASSKCGQAKIAGQDDFSVDFEGFFEKPTASAQISYQDLVEIKLSKQSKHWKLSTPDGLDYYREFNGPLTNYTEDTSYNTAASFTGTISIVGDLIVVAS